MHCKTCGHLVDFLTDRGECLYCDEKKLFSPAQSGDFKQAEGAEDFDALDPVGEEGHID